VSDNKNGVLENASMLPYIIENMLLSFLQEIMDDQKNMDESSSSIKLLNKRSDSRSLTISERDILYER